MRRVPLAVQVTAALLLVLGIALGVGFYPALLLEGRQLQRQREASMANLALGVATSVAARSRGEVDEAGYRASLDRLLSVRQFRSQIVSLDISSFDAGLAWSWTNPDLVFLKSAEHRVIVRVPGGKRGAESGEGAEEAPEFRDVTTYPDVQTLRLLIKGEGSADLATATLEFSKLRAKRQEAALKRQQYAALGLAFLLVLGTSFFMVRQISRPVQKIIGAMDKVATGDFDVDLKPSGAAEVRRLAETFNQMAAELKEKERLRMELQAAKAVQTFLLPRDNPTLPGYAVDSLCVPATEVGGDFYQFFHDGSGGLSFVIGDVSGKGMRAAMLVSLIMGALQTIVRETREPVAVLTRLNEVLCDEIKDRSFATVLFGHLDPGRGVFSFANAGHLYPFHFSAAQSRWREVELPLDRFPAGLFHEVNYQAGEIGVEPGDHILLLSDGVVEARDEGGDIFGDERLMTTLESLEEGERSALGACLTGKVALFQGAAPQADDVTVIAIRRASP